MTAEKVKELFSQCKSTEEFVNELCGQKGTMVTITEVADALADYVSFSEISEFAIEQFLECGKLIDEVQDLKSEIFNLKIALINEKDRVIQLLDEKLESLK
jgi:hypothetical protein